MKLGAVNSTLASHLGYDFPTRTLWVRFKKTGDTYQYREVTPSLFGKLADAHSIGSYYNRYVKGKIGCDGIVDPSLAEEAMEFDYDKLADRVIDRAVNRVFKAVASLL